jgi:hypothetical protein
VLPLLWPLPFELFSLGGSIRSLRSRQHSYIGDQDTQTSSLCSGFQLLIFCHRRQEQNSYRRKRHQHNV